jgi:superfamily I DNA/RNA helicase
MKLNLAQQLAVDTIEGPVMVIAGPGTGKTQIIAERIANILKKTDTDPGSILALTFTESGAKAMRERLIATIGEAAYYVNFSTFHALPGVIWNFPNSLRSTGHRAAGGFRTVEIFQQILQNEFNYLRSVTTPFYYVPALIKAIQNLNAKPPPSRVKKSLAATKIKIAGAINIFELYQAALSERGRYDFEHD